ncbi:thiamine-phosphate pyrophosphorylase [Dyadobacter koreensis]|uniref:Thiamine-phosphate pyrophosphorylase n=1 Tax=Dyadobacter koreensis TaxID=408657 RepID=A0A1H6SAS8_9BACT|nr:thiamine phosphate synthase [Dyadobacter koreensis]SEI61120.1 thiamine-phosphate pyrophosphorylase [Dyadobacter koreensis]
MKLLAISNPEFIPDEAELINSLFREGLVCLHIRKPESSEDKFRALINRIDPDFIDRIAIHQHHNLTEEFGIRRLHFTEKDRKMVDPEILKTLKSNTFLLSTSIHDLAEMDSLSPYFNYALFGPVFDSISKTGYKRVLPDDFYIKSESKKITLIGLGGISTENLEIVREMNFDGAAILGMLWREPENVIAKFREIRDVVNVMN